MIYLVIFLLIGGLTVCTIMAQRDKRGGLPLVDMMAPYTVFFLWPLWILGMTGYALWLIGKGVIIGGHYWSINKQTRSQYKYRAFFRYGAAEGSSFSKNRSQLLWGNKLRTSMALVEFDEAHTGAKTSAGLYEREDLVLAKKRAAKAHQVHLDKLNSKKKGYLDAVD